MPYFKRRYPRTPWYRKYAKRVMPKKTFAKRVKSVIKKEAELKIWEYNNGVNGQLINRSVPVIINICNPAKGDEYYERNGNKINVSSLMLRLTTFIKSGVIARFMIFKTKESGTADGWNPDLVRIDDSPPGTAVQYNIYGVPSKVYNQDVTILRDWSVSGHNGSVADTIVLQKQVNLKSSKLEWEKDVVDYPLGGLYLAMVASVDGDDSPLVFVNTEARYRDI